MFLKCHNFYSLYLIINYCYTLFPTCINTYFYYDNNFMDILIILNFLRKNEWYLCKKKNLSVKIFLPPSWVKLYTAMTTKRLKNVSPVSYRLSTWSKNNFWHWHRIFLRIVSLSLAADCLTLRVNRRGDSKLTRSILAIIIHEIDEDNIILTNRKINKKIKLS